MIQIILAVWSGETPSWETTAREAGGKPGKFGIYKAEGWMNQKDENISSSE